MPVPSFDKFMLPLLNALSDDKEHTLQELYVTLSNELNLTEEDMKELLPSGKQKVFHSRIGWARTYLKKAELLHTVRKATFTITEAGKELLSKQPTKIDKNLLKNYEPFILWMNKSNTKSEELSVDLTEDIIETPTEQIERAHQTIESDLIDELLTTIKECSPQFFEQLVVDLMLAMGYGGPTPDAGKVTQYSNDGGIDGIINEDALGLDKIYLQAKRYSEGSVGRSEVQAFSGALDMTNAIKGVFITTSRFSSGAIEFANQISKNIILINGEKLAKLMIDYDLGVNTKQTYKIKQIDSDYFTDN